MISTRYNLTGAGGQPSTDNFGLIRGLLDHFHIASVSLSSRLALHFLALAIDKTEAETASLDINGEINMPVLDKPLGRTDGVRCRTIKIIESTVRMYPHIFSEVNKQAYFKSFFLNTSFTQVYFFGKGSICS